MPLMGIRIHTHARLGASVLGLALLAAPAVARASGPDLFGYGARGVAMAGAPWASSQGHAAVYYNPAALAFDEHLTFAIGFQRAALSLQVNGEPFQALDAPALDIGFGIPLPFGGVMQDRLTLGLAFVLPQTSILIADTPRPSELQWVLLENRAQTVSIQAALGARITDWLSIGWGVLALAELEGAIEVAPNATGRLGSQARDELFTRYSQVVSVHTIPHERLDVSLTWRQESRADYTLPIEVDLGDEFPLPIPTLGIGGTAQFDPQQVTLGIAGRPIERLLLEGSVSWKQWSAFPNPIRYTAVPDDYPAQPAPGFSDTWIGRVAFEVPLTLGPVELAPRGGLAWEPTPVPEQTGLHNYLDSNRLIAGLGSGVAWRWITFDLGVQWQEAFERTHTKQCVTDASGNRVVEAELGAVIPTSYPGSNPGCDGLNHRGSMFVFNTELGVRF